MSRTLIIKPSNDTASSYGAPLFVVSESRCARSAQFVGERTGFARLSVMAYPPPHRVIIVYASVWSQDPKPLIRTVASSFVYITLSSQRHSPYGMSPKT
ncbi:hypothetical protein F2Q69_00059240 [Brassica cretica]|uniref:Uncharacterized protein n=1 Tax=Brassica cretica TaxID=69181 RepID=A0A8S9RMA1_BRACR|nr:hypothetical protein F2Q69_00059240 [Brassica cretica]